MADLTNPGAVSNPREGLENHPHLARLSHLRTPEALNDVRPENAPFGELISFEVAERIVKRGPRFSKGLIDLIDLYSSDIGEAIEGITSNDWKGEIQRVCMQFEIECSKAEGFLTAIESVRSGQQAGVWVGRVGDIGARFIIAHYWFGINFRKHDSVPFWAVAFRDVPRSKLARISREHSDWGRPSEDASVLHPLSQLLGRLVQLENLALEIAPELRAKTGVGEIRSIVIGVFGMDDALPPEGRFISSC